MALADEVKSWVAAGVIDQETADAIEAFEASKRGSGRIGRGMEAVAYLGAVLVLVALGILAGEFWDELEPWGRFTLGAGVTFVLLVVGWVLGRSDEPAVSRARAFAWLLAVAAVALSAQVGFSELADFGRDAAFLSTSLVTLGAAAVLWWLLPSILQLVAMWFATGATIIAVVTDIDTTPDWSVGVAFASVGVVWILLTWAKVLTPTKTSYALGAIGTLLIAFPEGGDMPWPLLGLGAGLALMALSVRLDETPLLGLGVAGLFVYIPMTIFELFGESLGVPVALLITGLILLGLVIATVRLRRIRDS